MWSIWLRYGAVEHRHLWPGSVYKNFGLSEVSSRLKNFAVYFQFSQSVGCRTIREPLTIPRTEPSTTRPARTRRFNFSLSLLLHQSVFANFTHVPRRPSHFFPQESRSALQNEIQSWLVGLGNSVEFFSSLIVLAYPSLSDSKYCSISSIILDASYKNNNAIFIPL